MKTIAIPDVRNYYTADNFKDVAASLCDDLDRDVERTAEDLARIAQAYGWTKDETNELCFANGTAMFGIIEDGNTYDPEDFKVDGICAVTEWESSPMREDGELIEVIESALSDALASRVGAILKEEGDEFQLDERFCPDFNGTKVVEMWLIHGDRNNIQVRTYREKDGFEDYVGFKQLPLALQDAAMRSLAKTLNDIVSD